MGDQPDFLLADAAYDRIYNKLKNGSRFEWSYPGTCPHPPGQCVCAKFMNVLQNDKIIRIVNGQQKPVHKASVYLATHSNFEIEQVINLFLNRLKFNPGYASAVKELAASGTWPKTVYVFMDADAPPKLKITCPSHAEFTRGLDRLLGRLSGLL